ncbi:MAG: hypothetical protein GY909_14755 [Oligoflexia bacterium]|nr:hypothetical protein [Oligoflexia bacterium]
MKIYIFKIFKFLKPVLRSRMFVPFVLLYSYFFIRKINELSSDNSELKILVFNKVRYMSELSSLSKTKKVTFIEMPDWLQAQIHSLCVDIRFDRSTFFLNRDEEVKKQRNRLYNYLKLYIPLLKKIIGFDLILTCSFYYIQDQEWDRASEDSKVPFAALYKENLKYEVRKEFSVKLYQERNNKFYGRKLIVFDFLSKEVLAKAKVCDENKIEVCGMMRFDDIFDLQESLPDPKDFSNVVLFSFRHAIGGTLTVDDSFHGGFSIKNDSGVCNLFHDVHNTYSKVAQNFPKLNYKIKLKWKDIWKDRVEASLDSPKSNIEVVIKSDAQEMIRNSRGVIGINSTTLLEALFLKRPVILPFFHEASEKYPHEIYFKDFFDTFYLANSNEEYQKLLTKLCNGELEYRKPSEEMIRRYIGFFDGKNKERVFTTLHSLKL